MKLALIDDNNTVLKVNQLMLKKEGFINDEDIFSTYLDISTFTNQNKQLNELSIIMCDYDLGKHSINGLEFLKQLKSNGYKGVCVLLTGDDTMSLRAKMSFNSNIHYVIKNTNKDNTSTYNQLGTIINNTRNKG